jgi:hypothetical protein
LGSAETDRTINRPSRYAIVVAEETSMSKLTTKGREKLSEKAFALPGHRYPIEDAPHARNAKARASQQAKAGKLPKSDLRKIDAKADKVLKQK